MSRFLTKKLLESGKNDYLAQVGLTYYDTGLIIKLLQAEVNRRRESHEKDSDYQRLQHTLGELHEAHKHLKIAYNARQEGRYQAKLKREGEDAVPRSSKEGNQ